MTYVKKQNQGNSYEESSPEELRFVEAWQRFCTEHDRNTPGGLVRDILNPSDNNPLNPATISDRDRKVVATTIQWLATSLGQKFLSKASRGKKFGSGNTAFARKRR